ncbi:hypothetical protein VTK73DRAFT_6125 [Phialemonium thermophilum]|uniref:Zn(2)-C6 fungal-type domain-containing protein n=1 Tax=Phialemonium thermophilum TaxID=223376 RepID=A0ABR3WL21_9PEZI
MADFTFSSSSASPFQGFSVFQPALGASLQWLPAMGTKELDDLVHAFLPGPSSIQDKRAHISMDFYEFSRQTGENFKFYPVYTGSFASASTATASPASSSAMCDSGYGSSFNVSPITTAMTPWFPSQGTVASTPPSAQNSRAKQQSTSRRKSVASSSLRQSDFSNHPGMRILTKDGVDITNSASRGCKTKEQRDHAHLMRIIKACESCRRKKVRCDPSHKKRTVSQAQDSPPSGSRSAKKSKRAAAQPSPPVASDPVDSLLLTEETFPELDATLQLPSAPEFENSFENHTWEQFVHFDNQGAEHFLATPDLTFDSPVYIPQGSGVSHSNSPSNSFISDNAAVHGTGLPFEQSEPAPALPYLNPGGSYGTNYMDFSLYSPDSDLSDEEPQPSSQAPDAYFSSTAPERAAYSPASPATNTSQSSAPTVDRNMNPALERERVSARNTHSAQGLPDTSAKDYLSSDLGGQPESPGRHRSVVSLRQHLLETARTAPSTSSGSPQSLYASSSGLSSQPPGLSPCVVPSDRTAGGDSSLLTTDLASRRLVRRKSRSSSDSSVEDTSSRQEVIDDRAPTTSTRNSTQSAIPEHGVAPVMSTPGRRRAILVSNNNFPITHTPSIASGEIPAAQSAVGAITLTRTDSRGLSSAEASQVQDPLPSPTGKSRRPKHDSGTRFGGESGPERLLATAGGDIVATKGTNASTSRGVPATSSRTSSRPHSNPTLSTERGCATLYGSTGTKESIHLASLSIASCISTTHWLPPSMFHSYSGWPHSPLRDPRADTLLGWQILALVGILLLIASPIFPQSAASGSLLLGFLFFKSSGLPSLCPSTKPSGNSSSSLPHSGLSSNPIRAT